MSERGLLRPVAPTGGSGGGASTRVFDEPLQGVVNNINKVFTASQNFLSATVVVRLNGLSLSRGTGYTVTGTDQITLAFAPRVDALAQSDEVRADYDLA